LSYNIYIGNGNYSINISDFNIVIESEKTRNFMGRSVGGVLFKNLNYLFLQVQISISYPENRETPLFRCCSGGTLRISDISFTTKETESLSVSLIIIEGGGLNFLFDFLCL
jgi:hypothetical protein